MSNATDSKARSDVTRQLNKFKYPELAIYVFSYLGVFDDIRRRILALIAGESADWLYGPAFLHGSVIVPCFSIGKILAKKHKVEMPQPIEGKKPETLDKERRKAEHKYNTLGFLLSYEMVVDYFKIMQTMTQEEVNKINLRSIFPGHSFEDDGNILLGEHTKFSGSRIEKASIVARSRMVFEVTDANKLSPVFKLLPHAYLRTKYEVSADAAASKEDFARPSVSLSTMFDQAFWGNFKQFPSFPSVGPSWVTVPKALLPSFWWDSIVDPSDLISRNEVRLLHDCILVSANYSPFDVHQTNMEDLISRLYQEAVAKSEPAVRPESPPGDYPPDSIRHIRPFVDAPRQRKQAPRLALEPHQHPGTMHFSNQPGDQIRQHGRSLQPVDPDLLGHRGEITHFPASNVAVQQSVLPQALFGHLLHVSTSFDLATYLNIATHDESHEDEDLDAGGFAASTSDLNNLAEFGGLDVVPLARNNEAPAAATAAVQEQPAAGVLKRAPAGPVAAAPSPNVAAVSTSVAAVPGVPVVALPSVPGASTPVGAAVLPAAADGHTAAIPAVTTAATTAGTTTASGTAFASAPALGLSAHAFPSVH